MVDRPQTEYEDGQLRLLNGELERYLANGDMWILPEQYAFFQTAHRMIRNFGKAQLVECTYNMYSSGCWENMNQVFTQLNDDEKILELLFNASVMYTWI